MNRADTLACAHDDDLIARAALGLLAPQEEPELARRLAACAACRERLDQDRALAAALAALDPHPAPITLDAPALHAPPTTRTLPDADGDEVRPATPVRAPRHITRRPYEGWYVAAAVLLLAGMAAVTFGAFARGPLAGRTHTTATAAHTPGLPTPTAAPVRIPGMAIDPRTGLPADLKDAGFTQVRALGPDDLWGLGHFWQTQRSKTNTGVSYTYFGHFDGQKWTIWPVPLANVALDSFSMDSDTDGWAVGSLTSVDFEHGILVHFANGVVTLMQVPGAGQLFSVQMLSATEGWAVGNAPSDGTQPGSALHSVTLHYVNGAWHLVPNALYSGGVIDLSMDSPAHGWVLNDVGHLGSLAGSNWTDWHQTFADAYFASVSSVSPNDAWAVGRTSGTPTSEPSPVVLHFDGRSWVPLTIPALMQSAGAMLNRVTMLSPTDGWMTGLLLGPLSTSQPQEETPIVLHYDGSQWQPAAAPANVELSWISMASSNDGWALGMSMPSGAKTYLFHYQHGVWSVATQFA